jgi:hypothetical protein
MLDEWLGCVGVTTEDWGPVCFSDEVSPEEAAGTVSGLGRTLFREPELKDVEEGPSTSLSRARLLTELDGMTALDVSRDAAPINACCRTA